MPPVIQSIDQITPTWLTEILREGGHLNRGHVVAVRPAEPLVAGGGPGFRPSNRVRVSYSADTPSSAPEGLYLKTYDGAIYKDAGPREITFYTSLIPEMPYPPAMPCYHAAHDPESGAYCILLADVAASHRTVHPEGPATKADTEQMLDALARLHAFWWEHPRLGQDVGPLPTAESIRQAFSQLCAAFPSYVEFLDDRLSAKRRRVYEQVLTHFPDSLIRRLAERTRLTIVHNDAHAGNFLLANEPGQQPSYIVDWEEWSVHFGPADVAYLVALFWYPERRARLERGLVQEYHDRLVAYGVSGYDAETCWADYRFHAIENLLVPLWAWIHRGGHWGYHRWHQLEKAMLAFHDLQCAEFLS